MKTVEVGKSFGVVMVGGHEIAKHLEKILVKVGDLHRLIIQISRVMYEEEI